MIQIAWSRKSASRMKQHEAFRTFRIEMVQYLECQDRYNIAAHDSTAQGATILYCLVGGR